MNQDSNSDRIGRAGEDVLALAFAGGGFDTAMQLGVIHALLISDGRPPDVVAGISAGAVNAVALADVFQAGEGLKDTDRLAARVARLREILEAYQQSPEMLYNSLLPDPYEVGAHRPLEPVKLPIHHQKERDFREELIRERSGLIALLNDLLSIRLPVRVITQVVRRVLGIIAAADQKSRWKRWRAAALQSVGLWWIGFKHLSQVSPLVGIVLRAWRKKWLLALPPALRWQRSQGRTAGSLILRSRLLRAAGRAVLEVFYFLTTALLWLLPVVLLLTLPLLLLFYQGRQGDPGSWLAVRVALAALWAAMLGLMAVSKPMGRQITEVLLGRYSLVDSLASPHPLRQMFVRLFDPVSYYGQIDLRKMLDAALRRAESTQTDGKATPKKLADFFAPGRGDDRIFVAPVAANIQSGSLTVLPQQAPVVDALLAAMAVVPLFPAQRLEADGEEAYYIDGINVANEPTSVLMELLREKIHPEARRVKIFAVSALPVSRSRLPDSNRPYQALMPVVERVLALKRFRDATLERRLTQLHTRVADEYVERMQAEDLAVPKIAGSDVKVLRADFYSIEPDRPLDLNSRLSRAESTEKRRRLVLEAVAEGCRAGLETMIPAVISKERLAGSASCWHAIKGRRGAVASLPGSQQPFGPGLVEVCQACALNQGDEPSRPFLRVIKDRHCSTWPLPRGTVPPDLAVQADCPQAPLAATPAAGETPRRLPPPASDTDPKVSLLFSGGVFRGVFQMGAIAALSELDASPQVFAGASVGSITAAMAARVFATPPGPARNARIALLAATFLTLDRLVLTDRFSDFVRRFTLRAGAATFSIADADRFLRRYDGGSTDALSGSARKVLAGLERIFYLTPFELMELVKDLRLAKTASVMQQLSHAVQDFLDRFEVGDEILGTEPLAFLIAHHVLRESFDDKTAPDPCTTFAGLSQSQAALLAVTTNLTEGFLETLPGLDVRMPGDEGKNENSAHRTVLLQSLLASSAFPAVFRPRWSWEVFPSSPRVSQYVDGGVMDNLPLDAVVQYLNRKVKEGAVAARPRTRASGKPVPHLLFAASLEPKLRSPRSARAIARNWPALRTRAGQLGYNRKIDGFRLAQHRFRELWEGLGEAGQPSSGWQPLDIEVVTVKPEWLCGTFAFHPMLGFRRRKQAQNIAHGCAMTLGTLYAVERECEERSEAWGLKRLTDGSDNAIAPGAVEVCSTEDLEVKLHPQLRGPGGRRREPGECWFRSRVQCPFANVQAAPGLDAIPQELHRIYELCGETETHRPPKGLDRLYEMD